VLNQTPLMQRRHQSQDSQCTFHQQSVLIHHPKAVKFSLNQYLQQLAKIRPLLQWRLMSHHYYEQTESFSEEMDPLSVF
jgi:hypothetical protein